MTLSFMGPLNLSSGVLVAKRLASQLLPPAM